MVVFLLAVDTCEVYKSESESEPVVVVVSMGCQVAVL